MRTKQRNNLAETARHERVAQNTDVYAVKARNYKGLRRGSPVLCRNNWHIHHGAGQILLCTAGRGYYQEWGKPAQELNVGDTVYIAPEIKHWHGAAPESYFVHIAESVPNKNASNQWLEAVDEEEYLKLKQNKTIRKGCLIVVYFKSYFEGSLEIILGITLGKKEAVIIIGSCFLFTGTIMLFIYEHIVNSLFFSRKYVIMRHDKDFL